MGELAAVQLVLYHGLGRAIRRDWMIMFFVRRNVEQLALPIRSGMLERRALVLGGRCERDRLMFFAGRSAPAM